MHHRSHDQGVSVQGGLCPRGSLSRGLCLGWSLSRGSLGSLCSGGLCLGRSLSREVSVWGVSVQEGGPLSRGISVQGGLCLKEGLCPGGYLSRGGSMSRGGSVSGGFLSRGVSVWVVSVRDTTQTRDLTLYSNAWQYVSYWNPTQQWRIQDFIFYRRRGGGTTLKANLLLWPFYPKTT